MLNIIMVTEATTNITVPNKKTIFYSGQSQVTFLLLKFKRNCQDSDFGNDLLNPEQNKASEAKTSLTSQVCSLSGETLGHMKSPSLQKLKFCTLFLYFFFFTSGYSWWATSAEDCKGEINCSTWKDDRSTVMWNGIILALENDRIKNYIFF